LPEIDSLRITVRPAALDEALTVLDVINESCAWLHATGKGRNEGVDQWPECFELWEIQDHVAAGEFYLAYFDGQLAATFRLTSQPEWYGEIGDNVRLRDDLAGRMNVKGEELGRMIQEYGLDQPALYLHTFAIRRSLAGQGLGYQLLRWGEEQARGQGFPYLRLDCHHVNRRLRQYYVDAGFQSLHVIAENPFGGIFHKRLT
jgi:GNAT superfamily N-acetyltransferase